MLPPREQPPMLNVRHWYIDGGVATAGVASARNGGMAPQQVDLPMVAAGRWQAAAINASFGLLMLAAAGGVGVLIATRGAGAALIIPALLTAILLIARPEIGILFVAATIPLEGATLLGGEVSAGRALGVLVAGAWAFHRLWRRQPWNQVLSGALPKLCLIFACYAGISLTWSIYDEGHVGPLFQLAQLVILTILVADLGSSWEVLDRIARAILVGTLIAATLILLQYHTGLVTRAGEGITGGSPNTAGRVLVTALPFAFYLVGSTRTPFWRILAIVYMAAATLGVAATFSRTSFLMLPVVTVLCLFRVVRSRRAVAWMVVPGIAVLLSMSLIPSDRLNARIDSIGGYIDDTFRSTETGDVTSSRGYHLRIALAMFTDHPYFGSGFDSFGRGFLDYQLEVPGAKKLWRSQRASHSSHAGLLADLGLAGIVLWTALFIGALAYTSAAFRSFSVAASSPRRDLVYAIGVTILVQLLYGFAADVHKDKLLWLLFGLVIAVYRVSRQESAGAGLRYPVPQPGQAP